MLDQDADRSSRAALDRLGNAPRSALFVSHSASGVDVTTLSFETIGAEPSATIQVGKLGGVGDSLAGRAAAIGLLDLDRLGDVDDVAALVRSLPSVALVRLPLDADQVSTADLCLFDVGFVRLSAVHDLWPTAGRTTYLRSDRLVGLDQIGEPTGGVVSMATLGSYGRFGNQLFQWAFLKLYAIRSNCRVQGGSWIGNQLYGAQAESPDPTLPRQIFIEFTGVERTLWYMREPQINIDFQGFFQEIPSSWRRHKQLFRLLFQPTPAIAQPIDQWLHDHVPAGSTLVGLHIRRGDYLVYDHVQFPWFRPIPIEWYRTLLDKIWPTLERPVLIFASDEAMLIRHFHDYKPLMLPAPLLADPSIQYFPDFHALSRCDVLTVINSSFSRMASLLGADARRFFLPNMSASAFEPYDPWEDDAFWERFGSA